jgi:hypothetical protein
LSADNGIYIRQLKDGRYSVAHIASLYPEDMTDEQLDEEFSTGNVFFRNTYDEALKIAENLADTCEILEYGICDVPRKDGFKPPGIRGTYTVTIEKVYTETYSYPDVTPEQAERMARRSAEDTAKQPGCEIRVVGVRTVGL